MPYSRRKSYVPRKRTYRKYNPASKIHRRKKPSVPHPKNPITKIGSKFLPDSKIVWGEYIETGAISSAAATTRIGTNNLRLNSIVTAGGGTTGTTPIQNIGKYNTSYDKYQVLGAKVSVWVTNQSAVGSPMILSMYVGQVDGDAPTNRYETFTWDNTRNKIIPAFASSATAAASEIKGYWMTTKYIDLKKLIKRKFDPSQDSGIMTTGAETNPTQDLICKIQGMTLAGGTGAGCLNGLYLIRVTYRVKLYQSHMN